MGQGMKWIFVNYAQEKMKCRRKISENAKKKLAGKFIKCYNVVININ